MILAGTIFRHLAARAPIWGCVPSINLVRPMNCYLGCDLIVLTIVTNNCGVNVQTFSRLNIWYVVSTHQVVVLYCYLSRDYINDWDKPMLFECPNTQQSIVYVESTHANFYDDRRF